MGSGFKKRKKQMQALQEQLMQAQEDMKNRKVVGESGGGLVKVTLSGDYELLDIEIKKECIDPEDQDGLQDLIKSAYNNACDQLRNDSSDVTESNPLFDLFQG